MFDPCGGIPDCTSKALGPNGNEFTLSCTRADDCLRSPLSPPSGEDAVDNPAMLTLKSSTTVPSRLVDAILYAYLNRDRGQQIRRGIAGV